jgi:hypothetical protein
MSPDPCPSCGANRNVVGRSHRCLPRQIAPAPVIQSVDNGADRTSVTHNPITHRSTVTHTAPAGTDHPVQSAPQSKAAERQARYRTKHGATYRERHRDLMRQKRAAHKQRAA